ncbi:MAG: hypothetical protein QOF57_1149 [Frankiaceae bacterium]|jgi:hypothetical protein|nr:hypothetical protein [Frankiaceae bacterium]
MDYELLHRVWLAAHGTAWLHGDGGLPPDPASDMVARLTQCEGVDFVVGDGVTRDVGLVRWFLGARRTMDAAAWFAELRARGCTRLWVCRTAFDGGPAHRQLESYGPHGRPAASGVGTEYAAYGYVPEATAILAAVGDVVTEAWTLDYEGKPVRRPIPPGGFGYLAHYQYLATPAGVVPETPELAAAAAGLTAALDRASAPEHIERRARQLLAGAALEPDEEWLPPLYPDLARRLVAAGARSPYWSGGGAWGQIVGEPTSWPALEELGAATADAIVAGINAPLGNR